MLDLTRIELTKKDIEKGIVLPTVISEDLAYLSGFLAGDGSFNFRTKKHEYSIKAVGNPKDEIDFYNEIIIPLFKKLFNIGIKPRFYDGDTTYGIRIYSKSIFMFFTKIIGIQLGYKSKKISIPEIFKNNEKLIMSFIEGFADADFCFTLKKRYKKEFYYPCIEGESASKKIIDDIAFYLDKFGFKFTKCKIVRFDKRVNKSITTFRIDLNGYLQLFIWMMTIGFRNLKYIRKLEEWRKNSSNNKKISNALKILVKSSNN